MVDFNAETTMPIGIEGQTTIEDTPEWTLFIDGSSIKKRSRAKIVLITPNKIPQSSIVGL